MRRYRRVAEQADLVHYQWLPIPALDRRLLAPKRPRVYTMHWRLPETGTRIAGTLTRLLAEMDAVVVHSEHGARRLEADFGVPSDRLRVIPHGAFDYLTRQEREVPLPEELRAVEGPVILAFGLVRPYKGTDVLLEAFGRIEGAELWIAGMPRMPMDELRELAERAPGHRPLRGPLHPRRRDPGLHAQGGPRRPAVPEHRAVGRPLHGARLRPAAGAELGRRLPGDRRAGRGAARSAGRPRGPGGGAPRAARGSAAPAEALGAAAAREAATTYSWDRIGEATMELYRDLLGDPNADNPR